MATFRKTFSQGRINLDVENRLLPDGEFREANNIIVINNENNEEGGIRKSYSNKRLTNLDLGPNPITLGGFTYDARNKIYWLVASDNGSYFIEYDNASKTSAFILKDTRDLATRVFNLKKEFPCTAINIVTHEDPKKELILLTDNNMQPLCINPERAKTYGTNGFEKEDIFLIKKPPRLAPIVLPTFIDGASNYLEEKFISISYSYKYLDGEYSAASSYTNYIFYPSEFKLDYDVLDNLGMLNIFNAVRVTLNTGDKRVTDVRVQVKFSNKNELYIVETFNKANQDWGHNEERSLVFANEKIYVALPEREQFRSYDNVPRKALAQTVIGNLVVYGNYLEGYSLKDVNGNAYKSNFDLSVISSSLEGNEVPTSISSVGSPNNALTINLTGLELKSGSKLTIFSSLVNDQDEPKLLAQTYEFYLTKNYANASELAVDEDFIFFVESYMTNLFLDNYSISDIPDSDLASNTIFEISDFTTNTIKITTPELNFIIGGNPMDIVVVKWEYRNDTSVLYYLTGNISSLKSNRSIEAGLIYLDEFGRKTTPLTQLNNTIYIEPNLSTYKNKIKVNINHNPPAFAERYKIVVKQQKLAYQTIYATIFYAEGLFRWVKLENTNYDKVKLGDILIVKRDTDGVILELTKVKVLEIGPKEKNFIEGNVGEDTEEIKELAGNYMKIKLPANVNMNYAENSFNTYNGSNASIGNNFDLFVGVFMDDADVDIPVKQGSRVDFLLKNTKFGSDADSEVFEKTFFASVDYISFEDFYNNEVNGDTFPFIFETNGIVRGTLNVTSFGVLYINENPSGKLYLRYKNEINGSGSHKSYMSGSVTITANNGLVIFETEEKKSIESESFYESEQTFEIVDGLHQGNLQNQTSSIPAIIDLDYFNCFCFGNGAESYIIKDAFNENYLNVDLRPSAVSVEEYDEVVRSCDLTYSEPFNESSNINGLNVFNLATANFKDDIDKQYGSIQKIYARENDIVVIQKEKAGKVLFNKNAIYTADGNPSITSTNSVLGQYLPYRGNRGIGNNRESFSVDEDGRVKYASVRNGSIVRLSLDGIEDIVYGVKSFFRDLFISQPNARIISGYDPFLDQTVFSVGNEPERIPLFQCSNQIIKSGQDSAFKYNLQLNNLGGDIIFTYNITSGNATIMVEFNDITEVVSNVTGTGTITVERNSLILNIATITITPTTPLVSYTIDNTCPIGSELEIVMVVINDENDTNKTIINRFRTLGTSFISNEDLFLAPPITRFESVVGLEGVGSFPSNGSVVNIQAQKNSSNNGKFEIDKCNRMGFLVSSVDYNEASYLTLLNNIDTEFITVTQSGEDEFSINWSGNFVFNRSSPTEKLYLIWDYSDRVPVLADDSASVTSGGTVIIDILANDIVDITSVVTIDVPPLYGTATVNIDNTISYTHDGTENYEDEFTYNVSNGGCSATAKVFLSVGVSCSGGISGSGGTGIYEAIINVGTDTGLTGIKYDSQGVPDRFEIFYDNIKVADSKYVGDSLAPGPPVAFAGLLGTKTGFHIYNYNGVSFIDSGNIEPDFDVIQADISDNVTEPTDGNGILLFNKTNAVPTIIKVRITGPSGTAWTFQGVCPIQEEDIIEGTNKFVYGIFNEANKASTNKSAGFYLGSSPVKFYTNLIGGTNFNNYGWTSDNRFINDGVTWWEIDATGNILSTGTI